MNKGHLAAVVMSQDGNIQRRGITDQVVVGVAIKYNDVAMIFTMEVH